MKRVSGPRLCAWCGRPCVSLCDYRVIHSSLDFYPPRETACNLPMCDQHTHVEENGAEVCPFHHKLLHRAATEHEKENAMSGTGN